MSSMFLNKRLLCHLHIITASFFTLASRMKYQCVADLRYIKNKSMHKWALFFLIMYIILIVKAITIRSLHNSIIFGVYSVLVAVYILSRFLLAYFYEPNLKTDMAYTPTVSFVTPAKDEGDNIAKTLRAMLNTDYPKDRFDIITINDGSKDNTLKEMKKVQKEASTRGIRMTVVNWKENKGKRDGMAEGILRSKSEIITFIDSDSFVEPDTLRNLVKHLSDRSIAAVAGHADVYNQNTNFLTKMQAVRYYVAFKAYKSAEALFGCVTCCSGCCSAYRREYLLNVLDEWLNQRFLDTRCTYGDDRSITNYLIKDYKCIYSVDAQAYTVVPDNWKTFFRQQLRWKKSWTRESLIAAGFMWKKNPLMWISFYLGVILPLLAPFVMARVFVWMFMVKGIMPYVYICGLILMSALYGVYYYIYRKDNLWIYGVLFAWFYSLILVWQLPYAILRMRDSTWGTR